jgi:hypothetical protein
MCKKSAVMMIVLLGAIPTFAAESEFHWDSLNESLPYATTREEAIRHRAGAFSALEFPSSVIAQMLRVTEESGEKVSIVAGQHFESMVSKDATIHHDVTVLFEKPLSAEKWEMPLEGRILTIFMVYVPRGRILQLGYQAQNVERS